MSQPPYKMGLLAFGDNGWGDELFFATLMTLAVAITAMFIGFIFSLFFFYLDFFIFLFGDTVLTMEFI